MRQLKCLLKLNKESIKKGNLKKYQKKLFADFKNNYDGTIIITSSD